MTKSDTPLRNIDTRNARQPPNRPRWTDGANINAFDTETHDGDIFCLSYAMDYDGDTEPGSVSNRGELQLTTGQIMRMLTHHRAGGNALNMWFNLSFDSEAILANVMSAETLAALGITNELDVLFIAEQAIVDERDGESPGETIYEIRDPDREDVLEVTADVMTQIERTADYTAHLSIIYLKDKLLSIGDQESETQYDHYDIGQFFFSGLDAAAGSWLGKGKEETVETPMFGSLDAGELADVIDESGTTTFGDIAADRGDAWTTGHAREYIRAHWRDIISYAETDAGITQELAFEFVELAEDIGIPCGAPISSGYLSEQFIKAVRYERAEDAFERESGVRPDEWVANQIEYMKSRGKELTETVVKDLHNEKNDMIIERMDNARFGDGKMQSIMWECYYGGRFEVARRGTPDGGVAGPDINSAYPAVLADMPDPSTLEWEHWTDKRAEMDRSDVEAWLRSADYGGLLVRCSTDESKDMQPFALKMNGQVKFPSMDREFFKCDACRSCHGSCHEKCTAEHCNDCEGCQYTPYDYFSVLNETFVWALDHGFVADDWEIVDAALGFETDDTRYPFGFINDFYDKRKMFASDEYCTEHDTYVDGHEEFGPGCGCEGVARPKLGSLVKLALNSMYGKLCQTTEKKSIVRREDAESLVETPVNEDGINEHQASMFMDDLAADALAEDDVVAMTQESGPMFNPFLASHVTGLTRLELLKRTVEYDLLDDLHMMATDCLMFDRDAFEDTSFTDDLCPDVEPHEASTALGMWDFDYRGAQCLIVGSGVYEVDFGECRKYDCPDYQTTDCDDRTHWTKTKTRGFRDMDLREISEEGTLRAAAREAAEHDIAIESSSPLTLGEWLNNGPDLQGESVAEFITRDRSLRADFDQKRVWETQEQPGDDGIEIPFGSADAAAEMRDEYPEARHSSDRTGSSTLVVREDMNADAVEYVELIALSTRTGEGGESAGMQSLTDAEKEELKRNTSWTWQKYGFRAMRVKAALIDAGVPKGDWTNYYVPGEGREGALRQLEEDKYAAAERGTKTAQEGRDPRELSVGDMAEGVQEAADRARRADAPDSGIPTATFRSLVEGAEESSPIELADRVADMSGDSAKLSDHAAMLEGVNFDSSSVDESDVSADNDGITEVTEDTDEDDLADWQTF